VPYNRVTWPRPSAANSWNWPTGPAESISGAMMAPPVSAPIQRPWSWASFSAQVNSASSAATLGDGPDISAISFPSCPGRGWTRALAGPN